MLAVYSVVALIAEKHMKHVTLTERDIVRFCMIEMSKHPLDLDGLRDACEVEGGYRYIRAGYAPNFDEYPPLQDYDSTPLIDSLERQGAAKEEQTQ